MSFCFVFELCSRKEVPSMFLLTLLTMMLGALADLLTHGVHRPTS